jgi:hypothetical protein
VASRARAGRFVCGLSGMSVAPGDRGAQCLLTTRQLAASCVISSVSEQTSAWECGRVWRLERVHGRLCSALCSVVGRQFGRQVFLVLAAQAVRNLLIGATFGRGAAGPRRVAGSESGSFALLEDEGKDGGDHKTL